jgi:YidC/Oxa1 family membrane protein insertase
MDKKSAMAMLLILMLWMGYFLFFAPKQQPGQPNSGQDTLSVSTGKKVEAPSAAGRENFPEIPSRQSVSIADTSAAPVDTVIVSSDLYEYSLITRGGILTRALLKKYPAFIRKGKRSFDDSQPVQLIPTEESVFLNVLLHLKNSDKAVDLGKFYYEASTKRLALGPDNKEGAVTFTHRLPGGKELKLIYTFHHDSYLIEAQLYLPAELHGPKENAMEILLGPSLVSNEKNPKEDYSDYGIIYYDTGEIVRKSLSDLGKSDWAPSGEHQILWGGVKSKYFISAFFVPDAPMTAMSASGSPVNMNLFFRGKFPIPSTVSPVNFSVYVGPQSYEVLTKLDFGFQKIFQYGWSIIQPFCKISLAVLLWMHKWISNYALILVFFALLVKIVFYPATIMSTKSQIKMQQIQPLLNDLRVRYKDDPKKLQEETLRLYKEHKVNPLGGCLPLLVQMPVLFALFYVFQRTIEFRGAEAFGWIHDLSQPDPYYILPVTMGATTFLQQKLTPTQTEPKLMPMLYIMPVFMTFIFLNFSSGLVLYYTFVNIFQIIQQIYINRVHPVPAFSPSGPAAGKAVKSEASAGPARNKKKGLKRK